MGVCRWQTKPLVHQIQSSQKILPCHVKTPSLLTVSVRIKLQKCFFRTKALHWCILKTKVAKLPMHAYVPEMATPKPAKILIGISLDPNDSSQLLSWAVRVLARPNDTIVALHVLVGEEHRKSKLVRKHQAKFRQAKAHVISVLADYARTCHSKKVNLEAKVGVSSSVKSGLIEEAKSISADFLLLLGCKKRSKETSHKTIAYCLEHVPEGCAVVSIGKSKQRRQNLTPKSTHAHFDETRQWGTTLSNESDNTSVSPVRDALQGESNGAEDDNSSFWDSTMSGSTHQPLMNYFTFEEISNATNNFHPDNIVGRGGYSEVYRGDLSDGRAIAVKMLAKDNKDANKEEVFLTELGVLGHVFHPNTAKLVGCCVENGLYLIFNLSEKGTLASALHGTTSVVLDWPVRYKIALGVARGLHYLHECCKHRIIHRDIKASNVLLGPDYEPQITDFGLAKWLPNKWTQHAVVPIDGTFGYLAPEYFMHGLVDEKTDVYAFGVLLLEIITGRRPVESSKKSLLLWAKPLMESGNISELADPKLKGRYDEDQMHRSVLTACCCVSQSAVCRPSMSEVLELLMTGHDCDVAKRWNMPKFTSDELDDYSMVFGYEVPIDISLEEFL